MTSCSTNCMLPNYQHAFLEESHRAEKFAGSLPTAGDLHVVTKQVQSTTSLVETHDSFAMLKANSLVTLTYTLS